LECGLSYMATSHKYVQAFKRWSYGAELELVDWPRNAPLPKGMAVDDGNYTSVNSNGVAVDGKGKTYHLGGEILTAPSENIESPAEQFDQIKQLWPETIHNYRTGLNVHVRVPGLRDDLKKLKQLQAFVHRVMPELLPIIDPIPSVSILGASSGEQRCYTVRRKDHYTLLPDWRLALQMKARTPKEFFEAEAIHLATGKVHWAINPRTCVNLRQMLQTDTIEFRHFFMPNTSKELLNATLWCKFFLEVAFDWSDGSIISGQELLVEFDWKKRENFWPQGLPYDPWLDKGFYYTSPKYHEAYRVKANIEEWLNHSERFR
jgi:hypothetical protein